MTPAARRMAALFPREARDGQIFHGWGLGPNACPARFGWWVRWPSGRLDYLAATAGERGEAIEALRHARATERDEILAFIRRIMVAG